AGETATFTVADKLVEPSARPSLGLSAHAGWTAPRGGFDNRFDGGLHLGLDLEAPFRARWSAVGTLSYSRFEAAARGLDDQEWLSLTAGLKYAPKPGRPGRLRPYVTGALGLYEPDRGSTEAGYTLGVGLDYELDPDWALELGADYHDLFTDRPDLEFLALRLGIVYRLGGP
ncbi:MAG: outer membrane beta-barrel protein, partial [Acidobacteriota bacterium]